MRFTPLLTLVVVMACASAAPTTTPPPASPKAAASIHGGAIDWQPWTPATFAKAKAQKKLLLVTLVTEWCHWCHVMDEKTWGDAGIAALVNDRFVVVRVDADSRPDLAERYADWGWPALALLTPDAQPVTEWKGYQDARRFEGELRAYVADLDAGRPLARKAPVVDHVAQPLETIRDFTRAQLSSAYDASQGGWGKTQKYPLWAPVAVSLLRGAVDADDVEFGRARQTLDGELKLIDGVDGGMFQYSLESVWTAPHYEKLAEINGTALENYADAFAATGDARYAQAARDLARYLVTFMRRDDGGFYANQDADSGSRGEHAIVVGKDYYAMSREARSKVGAPFIDRHVYASHNGRIIAGLARWAAVAPDDEGRAAAGAARAALGVVMAQHRVGVGFSHDEGKDDDGVLHLADQVAMGHALVLMAELDGDDEHRRVAHDVARFVVDTFADKAGGFYAHTESAADVGVFAERRKPMKQNAEAARLLLQVGRLDDDKALVDAANAALAAFATEAVVKEEGRMTGEYLLALEEQLREPLHFSIVRSSGDEAGVKALLSSSLKVFAPHRLIDVQLPGKFPDLGKASLYICGTTFCSPPITDPALVAAKAARYLKPVKKS